MINITSPFTGALAYALEKATNPFIKRIFNSRKINSIAVVLLQGIGNNVMFLPALLALQERFPQARIFIIAKKETIELLAAYKGDKNLSLMEYPANKPILERIKFFRSIRKNRFDIVVYGRPNRFMMPSVLCFFLGGYRLLHKYPVGLYENCDFLNSASIEFNEGISDVMNNLNLLKPLGIGKAFAVPELKIPGDVEKRIEKFFIGAKPKKTRVCIHIGCAQQIRIWPLEHFAELTEKLAKKHGCSIVLIGGIGEAELAKQYLKKVNVPVINAACRFSVVETAEIIKQCSLLITADSGPQHLAVSVGTPVISIYGPSSGKIDTQPVGKNDTILSLRLPCSPCIKWNSYACPLGTHFCLKGLTPDMVLDAVRKYIEN